MQADRIFTSLFLVALGALSVPALSRAGNEKVLICHHAGPTKQFEISVDEHAVPGHLGHGDSVGACDDGGGDPI